MGIVEPGGGFHPFQSLDGVLLHPLAGLVALGQQVLGPGILLGRRLAEVFHRLFGVFAGADALLVAETGVAQGGLVSHLGGLLVQPQGLGGVGGTAGAAFQAPAQIAGAPGIPQSRGLAEALVGPLAAAALFQMIDAQQGPFSRRQLLFLHRFQASLADRAPPRYQLLGLFGDEVAGGAAAPIDHKGVTSFSKRGWGKSRYRYCSTKRQK